MILKTIFRFEKLNIYALKTTLVALMLLTTACASTHEPDWTEKYTPNELKNMTEVWQAVLCGDNTNASFCGWK
jgi:hypothetical protein